MPAGKKNKHKNENINKSTYYVKGMHCSSCEILIENSLKEAFKVLNAKASTPNGIVTIEHGKNKPSLEKLNEVFKEHNYEFSLEKPQQTKSNDTLNGILTAIIIVIAFIILEKSGLASLININSNSSLGGFVLFGLIAGFSSCGALVGGIILAMTKQWTSQTSPNTNEKLKPIFLFNLGRILSYAVLGGVLGYLGGMLKVSLGFSSLLSLAISGLMIVLGLQMLGVKYFQKFQIALPKSMTSKFANPNEIQSGKINKAYLPFVMGMLTFFLPCGFTLTAQTIAITSGSAVSGALILLMFALGTLPSLTIIGITSANLNNNPKRSKIFSQTAGILVLFFALYNINAQLNVLGLSNISSLFIENSTKQVKSQETPEGNQIIKMRVYADRFEPNYFKVKKDVPVTWEITDVQASGCTNALISSGLFNGRISIPAKGTTTKTFTPTKVGKHRFSCWMGMVTGIVEVVE